MASEQNQINLGNEHCIPLIVMVSCLPAILFPGLFGIIARSALPPAIPFYYVCGGWQETGALRSFALRDII